MMDYKDLFDCEDHADWLAGHEIYVQRELEECKQYFDVEGFIHDHIDLASSDVMRSIIADAWADNNYESGEFENQIARMMTVPYLEVMTYHTERWHWELNMEAPEAWATSDELDKKWRQYLDTVTPEQRAEDQKRYIGFSRRDKTNIYVANKLKIDMTEPVPYKDDVYCGLAFVLLNPDESNLDQIKAFIKDNTRFLDSYEEEMLDDCNNNYDLADSDVDIDDLVASAINEQMSNLSFSLYGRDNVVRGVKAQYDEEGSLISPPMIHIVDNGCLDVINGFRKQLGCTSEIRKIEDIFRQNDDPEL